MAELFLSAAIDVLVEKLLSPEYFINCFAQREGVETAVKKWKHMLIKIQAVLTDAEEQQITKPTVKIWLNDLRDLAYDVEDVLDEFSTEVLRCKLMDKEPQASTSKLRSLIPSCCTSFKPSAVTFHFKMESKIKEITSRLQEIEKDKDTLGLRENTGGASNRTRERRASDLTSSVLPETDIVYGREEDKEAILQLLLGGEASDGGLCVIPIVGMGGVGKTTLAQLVYNDAKVNSHFDTWAWVCVSEQFDLVRVTKEILQNFTLQPSNVDDFNLLQVSLNKEVFKKKFLLVLDDVWHVDYHRDWTKLCGPLKAGAPGSKIIVTTRNEGVSKTVRTDPVPPYSLRELSDDDCLTMFAQHALGPRGFDSYPNLRQTGEKLAKRCKGLPLAAKVLGGFLRSDFNLKKWEAVLKSKTWEDKGNIIPALRLSYYHLPPHLKQCFAYCSILPEDYEFVEEDIVRLWMAVGLVQRQSQSKQIEEMEDTGSEYFHALLSRSFFQLSNQSRYVMHDLIKELAIWVAGKTCFRLEGQKQCDISENARYSSYVGSRYDGKAKFEALNQVKKLRTFLSLQTPRHSFLSSYVPLNLLPELRCLRVLSLRNYHMVELPDSLGNLKHLRYLDLSGSSIVSLPESTSSLYNLQTLILKDCSHLKKLPTKMENLINLRILDFTNASSIKEMPPRVGKLTSLRKLSNFVVGDDSESSIRELMNLKHLRGTLCISRLENVTGDRDAREANLKDKQELNGLTVGWSSELKDSRNEGAEKEVLDMLQPHEKLEELTIKWYSGIIFPTWIGDSSFSNMVLVRLQNCLKCTSLPPLGQLLSLKDIFIEGMSGVTTVGPELYGKSLSNPFPSLETLSFEEMPEWKDWFPSGVDGHIEAVFSSLKKLSFRNCPKLLGSLPSHLPSLEELIIGGRCDQLTVSISTFSKLCKLDIQGCEEVLYRSTEGLSELKSMVLSNISKFTCLTTQGFMQGLTNLEDLEIEGCGELTSLWQKEVGLLQNLTSLHRLEIRSCPKFVSLVAKEEEEELQQQQQEQGLPCSRLESLELRDCENLENLQGLDGLTSLRELAIKRCPRLVSVLETGLMHSPDYASLEELRIENCDSLTTLSSRGELPASLKKLTIEGCPRLVSVLETGLMHSLEELRIHRCDSLTTLSSRGELPASLKLLCIENCPKLGSVADRLHNNTSLEDIMIWNCESLKSLPEGLQNLNHLSEFWIGECPNLVSFPNGGCSAANLRFLQISNCIKLDALPDCASLQEMVIYDCPGMVCFPKDSGFLTNLTSLSIPNVKMWKSLIEWGLHRLTSLRVLEIEEGCPDTVSFPEEEKGMILPTSLTELWISNFPNLKHLSYKGFQNLTSLETLGIRNCPKLKSFPEEGLPPSLLCLQILECPLLKERCKKDRGRDWPKIALIPYVGIDGRSIYDPEEEQ